MGEAGIPAAKKGAHYSAPMPRGTLPVALAACVLLGLAPAPAPAAPVAHPEADARKAEEQLQAV